MAAFILILFKILIFNFNLIRGEPQKKLALPSKMITIFRLYTVFLN
jgi:hypothetical protein